MGHSLKYVGVYRGAHNEYLNVLVEFGLAGFIIFIIGIWKHYQLLQTRIIDLNRIMLKASFWAMLTVMLFSDIMWGKSFWLLWMMVMLPGHLISAA